MRPTMHLGLPSRDVRWSALATPMQGFDAVRLISQIVSVQTLHYLSLAFFLPPLLALLTFNRYALDYQGGVASLSLLLDWREIAGYPIQNGGRAWHGRPHETPLSRHELDFLRESNLNTSDVADGFGNRFWWEYEAFVHIDANHFVKIDQPGQIAWEGRRLGSGGIAEKAAQQAIYRAKLESSDPSQAEVYDDRGWWYVFGQDASRGWIICLAWAMSGVVDVILLATLIRRPTHILDHTITLHVLHLLLTWLYTHKFPSSLFYWLVMAAHAGAIVVWAEALSIKREMRVGWQSGLETEPGVGIAHRRSSEDRDDDVNEERNGLLHHATNGDGDSAGHRIRPHVLFDEEADSDEEEKRKFGSGKAQQETIELKRLG
jgi:hypothetical protein